MDRVRSDANQLGQRVAPPEGVHSGVRFRRRFQVGLHDPFNLDIRRVKLVLVFEQTQGLEKSGGWPDTEPGEDRRKLLELS